MQANYLKNKKRRPGVVLTPGKKYEKDCLAFAIYS